MYGSDYQTRDGTGDRDYVHVVDLAEGHVKAVDHILEDSRWGDTHIIVTFILITHHLLLGIFSLRGTAVVYCMKFSMY